MGFDDLAVPVGALNFLVESLSPVALRDIGWHAATGNRAKLVKMRNRNKATWRRCCSEVQPQLMVNEALFELPFVAVTVTVSWLGGW